MQTLFSSALFGSSYAQASSTLSMLEPTRTRGNKTRIAFGSCNRQTEKQPLWEQIGALQPDLWVWGGDAVYADATSRLEMYLKYRLQYFHPEYRRFLNSGIPIVGVWDDHDFGKNDSGSDYALKDYAQKVYLDFLGEPDHSPRRQQGGIYASYTVGPLGRQTKVILLDVRYHQVDDDILGDQQWNWLWSELESSQADVNLIVSGLQIIPDSARKEKWANFGDSRSKLLNMIWRTKAKGVVLISGDRHFAEISSLPFGEHHLVEITSSGMTHVREPDRTNQYRFGVAYGGFNFGLLDIDWHQREISVSIHGTNGPTRTRIRGQLDQLYQGRLSR